MNPKIRVPPNQALRCKWFCQKSRLSRPPEAPIFGKISRFRQNPEVPIFRKIFHSRKFLNRQISVKIRGFVRNFRKIWEFWHNYMIYWINSGYKYRVSDRGVHFFDTPPFGCIISLESNYYARYLCCPSPLCGLGTVVLFLISHLYMYLYRLVGSNICMCINFYLYMYICMRACMYVCVCVYVCNVM